MNTGSSRGATIRRGLTATVMMAAAGLTTLGATAAQAATTMPATHIHKAACTNTTLNVARTIGSRECFRGTGVIKVNIPHVRSITTGDNTGYLVVSELNTERIIHFKPHAVIAFFPPGNAKVKFIDITRN
jgi:hypothetical protein